MIYRKSHNAFNDHLPWVQMMICTIALHKFKYRVDYDNKEKMYGIMSSVDPVVKVLFEDKKIIHSIVFTDDKVLEVQRRIIEYFA